MLVAMIPNGERSIVVAMRCIHRPGSCFRCPRENIGSAGCGVHTVWSVLRSARWEQPPSLSVDLVGWCLGIGATWMLSIGNRL